MGFFIYDIGFLIIFTIFVAWFLYTRKHNVHREGILYLYKTQLGIKFIDKFSKKFGVLLRGIQYLVILSGYILMAGILYLIGKSVYLYLRFSNEIVEITKAPPVAPLIPYFPELFGMKNFFPPFYFTYFIVALIIVAVVHEFAHGIYAKIYGVRIKSTGFAFLGPILGAFVEQDDKQMQKKKNSQQMTILAAGTFANILTGLVFLILLLGFFYVSFTPSGYLFNTYGVSSIAVASVTGIGNLSLEYTEIYSNNNTFYLDNNLKRQLEMNVSNYLVLDDSPAFDSRLKGVIVGVDNMEIKNEKDLKNALIGFNPGDEINVKTLIDGELKETSLVLGEHPADDSMAYLGVGFIDNRQNIASIFSPQNPSTYYETTWEGDFVIFIYNLLFWIVLINILVAFFNMLPLGILDGGRFFYLTILSLTKSKKVAMYSFKLITYILLISLALLLFVWVFAIF